METYKNAPAREAILDIRILPLLTEVEVEEKAERLSTDFSVLYPDKKTQRKFEERISINEKGEKTSESTSRVSGYFFWSANKKMLVQLREDGFSFNMLAPYTHWNDFFQKAMEGWSFFRKHVGHGTINRMAIRYVNEIALPFDDPGFKFQDYISNMPPIPPSLPQIFKGFFLQTHVQVDKEKNIDAVITETVGPKQDGTPVFILDIDTFIDGPSCATEDMIKCFAQLREIKNKVFESCITDNTRRLFR